MSWILAVLGDDRFLLYGYVDPTAPPSAKGVKLAGATPTHDDARRAIHEPSVTLRLPGVQTMPLTQDWIDRLQLPGSPPWMAHFAAPAAAAAAGPWRSDPQLAGKFPAQYPDDIEATFILLGKQKLEKMWVRLDDVVSGVGYRGALLNTSHFVPALAAGARVMIRPSRSQPPAVWVPDGACADNLRKWSSVCGRCGFDLVFIPMAELTRMQFPDAPPDVVFVQMTTRCLMCRGTMHIKKL